MHRHWCGVRAHRYECTDPTCMCPCGRPMERHDYTNCPIELRSCAAHQATMSLTESTEADYPDWLDNYENSHKQKHAEHILMQLVFYDLRLLNEDIGAPVFRESDFFKAVERCDLLGIQIFKVDVLIPAKEIILGTEERPDGVRGAAWCRTALRGYLRLVDVAYAPTLGIPTKWFGVF